MQQYGDVGGIRHQLHPDSTVYTGTRIVRMVRKGPIPRHISVEGWSGKVWYRGQPVECDICGAGHVSRVCPMRNKCRLCGAEGHFARSCPRRDDPDWGEVNPPSTTDAQADGNGEHSVDLRDNQLDELPSQVASGSVSTDPDSLEGATVASQASSGVSQSVLAGLAPKSNSPNSDFPDAPNSIDSAKLNDSTDLPKTDSTDSLNNGMEVITGNSSENNNVNNGISNTSHNDNSNSNDDIEVINDENNSSSNKVNINELSDISESESEDGEIRSDASIGGGPSGDESTLDSVHSTDQDGFVVPMPVRRTTRKSPVVISPGRSRSVSPASGRSRSPLVKGKHSLPPAAPSRPKSRKS